MNNPNNSSDKKTSYLPTDHNTQTAEPRSTGILDKIVPWVIEFRVVGTPSILKAPVSETMIIGRKDHAHKIFPEIDLEPFDAQNRGVSRRHAQLLVRDNRVQIEDLDSSNGTFINDQKIAPKVPFRLREGDIVRLGRLELQVHFIVKPSSNDQTMVGIGNSIQIPVIGSGQRVLILDDDEFVCQVISHTLMQAGFQAVVTNSAADAIGRIDDALPDMMIVELLLSETSGLDIIRYIRMKNTSHYVPVMAIAATTAGFNRGQAEKYIDLFLGKPVAIDELMKAMQQMVALIKE